MRFLATVFAGAALLAAPAGAQQAEELSPRVGEGVPHPGFDQIYWVPTGAQAEEMAKATGRLIFAIGYCADWNGY